MSHLRNEPSYSNRNKSPQGKVSLLQFNPEVSLPSINPLTQRKQFNERTLQKIIELNREYLADKVRVSDVRRPSRYAYKMPSKTGHSEYNRIFAHSLPSNDLQGAIPNRSRMANNLKLPDKGITNYQSTYNVEFTQRKQEELLKRLQQAHRPQQYQRKEGPFFTQTSYHRDYHPHGSSLQSVGEKPGDHMTTGGMFIETTTYKNHYNSTSSPSPPAPIVHKDHSIFVKIGKPKQSSYQLSYPLQGKPRVEQSCKPKSKMMPILAKIKNRTEYSDEYVQKPSAQHAQFQCLSTAELKQYVLTILNQ